MSGSILRRHLNKNFELIGVFASEAAYLAFINKKAAEEGMVYYDTTRNQLRTHDGTVWSPAGMSGMSGGSLDAAALIGAKITSVGSIEIEYTGSTANLLILDANGTTNVDVCDVSSAGGSGHLLNLTQAGTGYDVDGTSSTWYVKKTGDALFNSASLLDDKIVHLGNAQGSGDVQLKFHDGAVGTAGNGLLIAASGADEQIQIGDATYSFDVWFVGDTATTNFMKWDVNGGADSVGALVFDNTDIVLGTGDKIIMGDQGGQTSFYYDTENSALRFDTEVDGIWFGVNGDGMDLRWYTESEGDYVYFNNGGTPVVMFIDVDLDLDDDCVLKLGSSDDFTVQYDGSNNILKILGANKQLDFGESGTSFDMFWHTETVGDHVYFDEDNSRVDFIDVDLRLDDDARIYMGSSQDAVIQFNGTTNKLDLTANVNVVGTLSCTGGLDFGSVSFDDDEALNLGASNDFVLKYSGTNANLELDAAAANDEFSIGTTVATDVRLNGANAGRDILFDASADALIVQDNAVLYIGSDGDIRLSSDNTNYDLAAGAANGIINVGRAVNTDVLFNGGDAGRDAHWDASADTLGFLDNAILGFGNTAAAPDVIFKWDASNLLIEAATQDTGSIRIGSTNTLDVYIYGATNTNYVQFNTDDAALDVDLLGWDLRFRDATDTFTFGPVASNALPINAGTANRTINFGDAVNTDIVLHGGTAGRDAHWDASANTLGFLDNAIVGFGNTAVAPDVSITWDSNSLNITGDTLPIEIGVDDHGMDVTFFGATAGAHMLWDESANQLVFVGGAQLTLNDDVELLIGTGTTNGGDFKIYGTADPYLVIDVVAAGTGEIQIGNDADDVPLKWFGETAGDYAYLTGDQLQLEDIDLCLGDGTLILFGDNLGTGSMSLSVTTNLMTIGQVAAGTGAVAFGVNDAGVDLTLYGDTAARAVHFDASADTLGFLDNTILGFGNTAETPDITFKWDTANLLIEAAAANGQIKLGATTNTDLGIYGATATNYWLFDTDDLALTFDCINTAIDLTDATSHFVIGPAASNALPINAGTANETINVGATTNTDVILHGGDAARDAHWDASADTLGLLDNAILGFGNTAAAPDITLKWDTSNLLIEAAAANGEIKLGATTNTDLGIYGATATNYWLFDTDDAALTFDCVNTAIDFHDGTSHFVFGPAASNALNINAGTADETINIGPTTATDVILHGTTAGRDCQWDSSQNGLLIADNAVLAIGNTVASPDLKFVSNGTSVTATGRLTIATGIQQTAITVTATADGTGTGTIVDGTGMVATVSDSVDKIIILPTPTPGTIVWLLPNATGYELRSSAPETVAINGGTGVGAESAVAAASTVRALCTSATTWIANTFAADGTEAKLEAAA